MLLHRSYGSYGSYEQSALAAALAVLATALAGCAPDEPPEGAGKEGVAPAATIPIPGWPRKMRGVNIILWSISEADIGTLAREWKANSVRLMVNELIAERPPHELDRAKIDKLHATVALCRKHGLFVVINQQPPGWQRNPDDFWKNLPAQAKYREAWVEIARRYAGAGEGVAYDIMNEPHGAGAAEAWSRIAKELTSAIREVDREHVIVVEPPDWGNAVGFGKLEPTGDARTVYSFHFYAPFDFTHQRGEGGTLRATDEQRLAMRYPGEIRPWWPGAEPERWDAERMRKEIQPALEFRATNRLTTMWVGEFGCTRWAEGASDWMRDALELWEAEGLGWAWYSYREWHAMDVEKPASDRSQNAPRGDTPLAELLRKYLARGAGH